MAARCRAARNFVLLASFNLIEHISDRPWPGCSVDWHGHHIVLMSSAIASMILVALVLIVTVIPAARRTVLVPSGGRNMLEVIVFFVRDWIAKPALHDHAYQFMPFLLTQFVFFLGMNLIGLLPLVPLSELVAGGKYPVGATPTGVLAITGANAALVLLMILFFGFREQAKRFTHHHPKFPGPLAWLLSPVLFVKSLVPPVPGIIGILFWPLLLVIELASLASRCAALMIRIFANMIAGHSMLAAFLGFIMVAGLTVSQTYVFPLSVLGSVFVSLLDVLVALIQAFVFTFLTAIFVGLYMEPQH